jgi:hypothetical protein
MSVAKCLEEMGFMEFTKSTSLEFRGVWFIELDGFSYPRVK